MTNDERQIKAAVVAIEPNKGRYAAHLPGFKNHLYFTLFTAPASSEFAYLLEVRSELPTLQSATFGLNEEREVEGILRMLVSWQRKGTEPPMKQYSANLAHFEKENERLKIALGEATRMMRASPRAADSSVVTLSEQLRTDRAAFQQAATRPSLYAHTCGSKIWEQLGGRCAWRCYGCDAVVSDAVYGRDYLGREA